MLEIVSGLGIGLGKVFAKYLIEKFNKNNSNLRSLIANEIIDTLKPIKVKEDNVITTSTDKVLVVISHTNISENTKKAILVEVISLLSRVNTEMSYLSKFFFNPHLYAAEIKKMSSSNISMFSKDEIYIFDQMVFIACESIMKISESFSGFLHYSVRSIFQNQSDIHNEIKKIGANIKLLEEYILNDEYLTSDSFEMKYKEFLQTKYNKFEPFGLRIYDMIFESIKLTDAFTELDLKISIDIDMGKDNIENRNDEFIKLYIDEDNEFIKYYIEDNKGLFKIEKTLDGKKLTGQSKNDEDNNRELIKKDHDGEFIELPKFQLENIIHNLLDDNSQRKYKKQVLTINEILPNERRLMIVGLPGSGKSTLLQWLVVNISSLKNENKIKYWGDSIPFFIRLRSC